MPDKYITEAEKLLHKKMDLEKYKYKEYCRGAEYYNKAREEDIPIVANLLKQIAELEAGSTEVGVEEIYEELKNWGGNIQSSQSLTSEEMDEFLKDIAQSINNLKEKE